MQIRKKLYELGIGALVENQKTGVHPMGHGALWSSQSQVYGVGVAAKVITGFKQGQVSQATQGMGSGQARDTGADDGNFHAVPLPLGSSRWRDTLTSKGFKLASYEKLIGYFATVW